MPEGLSDTSLALARRIVELVKERRATDVVLLDVRTLVDYTDFFLVASGQSGRQNQAIGEHVVKTLKGDKRYAISKSGLDTGSWICLDMGDVVVHVFDPETRARYDLELLWADAPRTDLDGKAAAAPAEPVPAAEAAPKKRRRVVRRAAVEDADAANAPEAARPPPDEPEPEAPRPVKRPKAAAKEPAKPAGKAPAKKRTPVPASRGPAKKGRRRP